MTGRHRRAKYQPAKNDPTNVLKIDNTAVLRSQIKRLKELRAQRDQESVDAALDALTECARTENGNLLDLSIKAARLKATVGEISSALEKVYGRFQPTSQLATGVYAKQVGETTSAIKQVRAKVEAFVKVAGRRPRILIAKLGQDGHDRGQQVVASAFADIDVTLRGAASIARRLQDPLAELVKIDPKSIGVGQYQHNLSEQKLGRSLDAVVEDCVNAMGVDVNTASAKLLARVSGVGEALAQAIVVHRETHGPFRNRNALKDVPRLGGPAAGGGEGREAVGAFFWRPAKAANAQALFCAWVGDRVRASGAGRRQLPFWNACFA